MERPSKRIRQACDPCRRKKSRCPGERPVCSYCARLGQICSYASDDALIHDNGDTSPRSARLAMDRTSISIASHRDGASNTNARLNVVESQLAEVISLLNQRSQHQDGSPSAHAQAPGGESTQEESPHCSIKNLPQNLINTAGELYMTYCDSQPLPLFNMQNFITRLGSRDKELVFAIAAISLRQDVSQDRNEQSDLVRRLSDSAGVLVMQRIATGTIELSTLQTLCLLSLVDFYSSNTHRASIYISLAVDLGQSAGLSWSCTNPSDDLVHEEQMRCFWSIVLLVRMHANLLGAFSFSVDTSSLLVYPSSTPRPPFADRRLSDYSQPTRQSSDHKDLGILTYVIQLSEVWQRVAQYARRRRQPEAYPPWSNKSEYAKILARQMERETLMPYSRHRYKPANFAERTSDELNKHRQYWGPWLLNQMMYHGILCLLNHPLLLSLRLRNFRVAEISEIWLQHTDDLVASHTKWIIHLIELAETKGFDITDPFLAHPAAIVATIYLQQSFADDTEVQQTKRNGYLTCLRFVQQIGEKWCHIRELATRLEKLEEIVSISYQHSESSNRRDKVYIDLTIFWEILESSLISENQDLHGINLGSSLAPQYHAAGNAEEVNVNPLPEPSRLHTISTHASLNSRAEPRYDAQAGMDILQPDSSNVPNDDFSVLAQSYFAQGQDFVGALDDWWSLGQA